MAGLSNSYPVYAPAEDLNAYLGETLADADSRLADASGQVRYWTKTALYDVAVDGFTPTDESLANAFHDATILQAAATYRAGLKPGDTGATTPGTIQSKTLGSRSVTYAANASADAAKIALAGGSLSPQAASVLASAGLLSTSVYTGGSGGEYPSLMSRVPGASATVTFVPASAWPPAADSNPLHLYVKVPG